MDAFNLFKKKALSKQIAKDRLQLLLVHDRIKFSSHILEMIKMDILVAISNYMDISDDELDIQIGQISSGNGNSSSPVLYANIPIKSMKKLE